MGGQFELGAVGAAVLPFALAGLFSLGGCGPSETPRPGVGSSGAAPAPVEPRSVQGTWAFVARDMDGTVVELDASGNGHGCLAGWPQSPTDSYATEYCGPVTGHVDGDRVHFDLALPAAGDPIHSMIDGTLSESGARIGGVHRSVDGPRRKEQAASAVRYLRQVQAESFPRAQWPESLRDWDGTILLSELTQGPFQA